MQNYLELRDIYLSRETNPRLALKSTNCKKIEYVLMKLIDYTLFILGIIGLVIFGNSTERIGLTFLFIILFIIFCITLKLWLPRTIGMRIMGLIYVKNYDCLPIDTQSSTMLYSYQEKYYIKENEENVGKFMSKGTFVGFYREVVPLYNEYHQTRPMMVNGVYLVKLKIYNMFKEDFAIEERFKNINNYKAVTDREDSPILEKSHKQIFKDHKDN